MNADRNSEGTRTRLLDAAEHVFAEQGFEGASLREITARAGANLAAAHYHFGSKEDLFVAVVSRLIAPINAERLDLFNQAGARRGGTALEVEEILHILIAPVLRSRHARKRGGCGLRLFGRMQSESEALWQRVLAGPLREIRGRTLAELHRALPRLPGDELALRMHFVIGVMRSVAADQHRLGVMTAGACTSEDVEGVIASLVPFLAAGMRAPATPRSRRTTPQRRARRSAR